MTDLRPSGPAHTGELLDGRYRLVEMIGEGGMGSVWRATDEALERPVAIKVFCVDSSEEADAVRRESEKRLLASLSHPSLVTLFDARLAEGGRSYLVMEYIDGGTLADRIATGPVSALDAASLAADLGEALHVVHQAGIIHRDVKPANVLLRPPVTPHHTFRAVLADFGIAYLVDTARVTTPGTAIGTAAYISPEQVRGMPPSPASDVYSLGLVLFESLSGQRAFPQRNPAEAIAARLSAQPNMPGDWGYGWRSLLTAMTALDPEDRPTALEVATRGRALDDGGTDPEATALMAGAPPLPDAPAGEALEATRVLPVEATAATSLIGESAAPQASAPTPAAAPADRAVETREPRSAAPGRRRRLALIVSAVVLAVIAAVVTVAVWTGSTGDPAPPPELPQVEEPLGTHLQDLMDEVTP